MSKEIGLKLKQLRKWKKLTQHQFADYCEIPRSTISNYEIGRRTPHLTDLQKIADHCGVALDYFGVDPTDEAFNLLARAQEVFESDKVPTEVKENLYHEFMKLYLKMKGEKK